MKKLIAGGLHLWRYGDTRLATVASVMSGYAWALCLAFPGDTIASRPIYQDMRAILPSDFEWFIVFFTVASLQLYRLTARLTKRSALFDHTIKFIAMSLWVLISVLCMTNQYPPAAAMSDTFVIAIGCFWDFMRHEQSNRFSYYSDMKVLEDADV